MDDANAAATKGDLQSAVEQLRSEMQYQFDELKETMRDSQTEILKAFEQSDIALRQRLNMPPAA